MQLTMGTSLRGTWSGRFVWAAGVALAAASLLTGSGAALAADGPEVGLVGHRQYIAEQFFWTASWSRDWTADRDLTVSEPGSYDQLVLHGDSAGIAVHFGYDAMTTTFATVVDPDAIAAGEMTVLGGDAWMSESGTAYLSATVAAESDSGPVIEYIEITEAVSTSLESGTRVTILFAPENEFERAFAAVQDEVVPNDGQGGPLFAGTAAGLPETEGGVVGSDTAPLSESEYLNTLNGEIDTLAQSVTDFQTLIQDPTFGNDASVDELARILTIWVTSYDTAQSIQPPAGYVDMHRTYVEFTGLLAGAAHDIANGDVDAAASKLSEAQSKLMRLQRMLQSGGTDIFDRKSG